MREKHHDLRSMSGNGHRYSSLGDSSSQFRNRFRFVPILLYGIEALQLSISDIKNFTFAYNSIFYKLFHCSDPLVIRTCEFHCAFWPFQAHYDYMRYSFLLSLFKANVFTEKNAFYQSDFRDFVHISSKYSLCNDDSSDCIKCKILNSIELSLVRA